MVGTARVLLVEGPEPRDRLREALEQAGSVSVMVVADAAAATTRLGAGSVDCVVSDHDPPGFDGLALLEAVRERRPSLPFVLCPAAGDETVAAAAIDRGVSAYVPHEAVAASLVDRVERVVADGRPSADADRRSPAPNSGALPDSEVLSARARRREAKLDQLRERSRRLMYTETIEETAQVAVEAADEIMGAPLSGFHVPNEAGDVLEPAALVTTVHEMFETPPTYARDGEPGSRAAIVWGVFESGEPRYIDDVAAYDPLDEPSPAGSVLLHPVGEHGVFVVSSDEPHAFDATDETLIEILSTSLTTALDRVEREQRLRSRQRRLERLHDATRDLMAARSREEIAARTVTAAEEILEFPIALVRFYDADAGGLVPVAETDSVGDLLPPRSVFGPGGNSLNWQTYEAGEVRLFDDIEEHDEAADTDTPLGSLMILPLGQHGTLSAGDTVAEAFDESDVFLARILSTAAETALARADREAELRRRRDELERQNEQLDEFASLVSHDLRNPLQAASGWLAMAREDDDREELAAVASAHDRMGDLIDELLTLARTTPAEAETEPVDLGGLADNCWQALTPTDATLAVETDRVVAANPARLRQLLENLLGNALRHGRAQTSGDADGPDGDGGAPAVTVTVGDLEDGFYVADDGPGIPAAERERIFEPGYSTAPEGTGFGLRIVERVADAHGWTVDVTEAGGGGARFELHGVTFVDD
jgi:signal transduction histidine kinase/CheY-like chemotaxis protein